jgi:antitoxin component HigA of HigAB toxin-antitoxin module
MKLKRFNELNEGKLDDFKKDVEEYLNTEYEEGEEPSNVDMLDEVGELMNKYNLTTDDLQKIVDDNPDSWEIQTYVRPQLNYEVKEQTEKEKLVSDLKDIIVNNEDVDKAVMKIISYYKNRERF